MNAQMQHDPAMSAWYVERDKQEQLRKGLIAARVPIILAAMQKSRQHVGSAFEGVSCGPSYAHVLNALLNDDMEAMRLIRQAMNTRLREQAEDTAEQEAHDLYPDPELPR